jgi:hypothetical protein
MVLEYLHAGMLTSSENVGRFFPNPHGTYYLIIGPYRAIDERLVNGQDQSVYPILEDSRIDRLYVYSPAIELMYRWPQ